MTSSDQNETTRRNFLKKSSMSATGLGLSLFQGIPNKKSEKIKIKEFTETTAAAVNEGEFQHIYNPGIGEEKSWYYNDHTFIQGRNGTWHLYGITRPEPRGAEDMFGHATAPSLYGPWTKQNPVLYTKPSFGETHLWAPHIIEHNGLYYMFYSGGGGAVNSQINLATSKDLFNWERNDDNPLFTDGWSARDPNVRRIGNQWVMYYTATEDPTEPGDHIVAYRTSKDLLNWGTREIAFDNPLPGGLTESPFVVERPGDHYYLFTGPRRADAGTDVFKSRDPFDFEARNLVAHIQAHAPEIIHAGSGPRQQNKNWFISHAGWGNQGVHLAPLKWHKPNWREGIRISTPGYRAKIATAPHTEFRSLKFNIGGKFMEVLSLPFRGTRPYMGIDSFGAMDIPQETHNLELESNRATLRQIQMGDQPVTFDWTFEFFKSAFDMSIDIYVNSPLPGPAYETAWDFEVSYPMVGDQKSFDKIGDSNGFPRWTMGTDKKTCLVTAYKEDSSWSEDNVWYHPVSDESSNIAWQQQHKPGGEYIEPGDYAAGTWRIGFSANPKDQQYANQLYEQLNNI